jgi:hypothetical protein
MHNSLFSLEDKFWMHLPSKIEFCQISYFVVANIVFFTSRLDISLSFFKSEHFYRHLQRNFNLFKIEQILNDS